MGIPKAKTKSYERTKIDTDPTVDRLFFSADDTGTLVFKVKWIEGFVPKEFPDAVEQLDPLGLRKGPESPSRLEVDRICVPFVLLVTEDLPGKIEEGTQVISNGLFEVIRIVDEVDSKGVQSRGVLVRPPVVRGRV
jgi:hypothetical protein